MNLLIFFALPLATILLAIVFEKILNCPVLVGITFFSVYLIIVFALFAIGILTNLAIGLVAVIIYTIIAFIAAYAVKIIKIVYKRFFLNNSEKSGETCGCCNNQSNIEEETNNDLLRISCRCNNGNSQELLTVNSSCLNSGNSNCSQFSEENSSNDRYFFDCKCSAKPK